MCGKNVWTDAFKWVEVKKVVSPVNSHQKPTATKEELNTQVSKMGDPFCG